MRNSRKQTRQFFTIQLRFQIKPPRRSRRRQRHLLPRLPLRRQNQIRRPNRPGQPEMARERFILMRSQIVTAYLRFQTGTLSYQISHKTIAIAIPNKKFMEKENNTLVNNLPIPIEFVERRIYLIRGQKVMLDSDLAESYQVPTFRLNEAVKT